MKKTMIVGLISIILLISTLSLIPDEKTVPAQVMATGDTNTFIGQGDGRFGSLASNPDNWNLCHVPLAGESVLFDNRSGNCRWDIDVWVHDFTVQPNNQMGVGMPVIIILNSHFHMSGNLTILDGTMNFIGYIDDNVVIDGWTHITGNNTGFIAVLNNNYGNSFYFNGSVNIEWRNFGLLHFRFSQVVCNSTFTIDGTTMPRDFISYNVDVMWDDHSYFDFKKDVVFNGTQSTFIGGGYAHESITFVNVSDYLLIDNLIPGMGFTFSQRPQFINITKCSTCGYTPSFSIEYTGELGFRIWDGWMTDFINVLNINGNGMVNQSYDVQYGSLTLDPVGLLNVNNGIYRVNGSYFLNVVNGITGNPGVIGINATLQGGSGWIYADYLKIYSGGLFNLNNSILNVPNIVNYGTFNAQTGHINSTNFDTSYGTFVAGDSTLTLNATGTLKTDGTQTGGMNDLVVMPNVTITLQSDVYVNGKYTNLGGTVVEGVYQLHYNESSNDSRITSPSSPTKRDMNAFIGAGARIGASASDPANWYLGHVPVDGEDLLFDARAGPCKWDLDGVKVHDVLLRENFTNNLNIFQGSIHITGNLTINATDAGLIIFELSGGNFVVDGWTHVGDSSVLGGTETASAFASYFNGSVEMDFPHRGQFAWGGVSHVVFNSTVAMNGTTMPMDYATYIVQVIWYTGAYLVFKGDVTFNGAHQLLIGSGYFEANLTVVNISDCLLIPDYPDSGTIFMYQPILINIPESA